MKEIRLHKLRISNFKGVRELEITMNGKDMNVFGENGTGKTTVIDSFTWLLFGKDSSDRADFGIKPTDKNGDVIHHLETSVEAVFDISGEPKTFKKTLTEAWTRKRGAAEAEFTRNENSFYIDDVPKKKSEYTAVIKELIDEEVFRTLTNPLYFNESVNWKNRRSVLLNICGEVSDTDVITANPQLAPLLPLLQGKQVSDFKGITEAHMKRVNSELGMIPVKINEAELAKPSAESMEADLAYKDVIENEIERLRAQRSNIINGSEVLQIRQKIKMLKQDLEAVGANFSPDTLPEAANLAELKALLRNQEFTLKDTERDIARLEQILQDKRGTRERYSQEWDEVFGERFTGTACPTCGRDLPEDEIEAKRKEFNRKKAQRLDEIESKNEEIKKFVESVNEELNANKNIVISLSEKIAKTKAEIEDVNGKVAGLIEIKLKEFEQERDEIRAKIAQAEALILTYEQNTEATVAEIDGKLATLSEELSAINEAIANKVVFERQNKRIAELKEQQIKLATEYTAAERSLYLAEQFIIAKVNMLNNRINEKFKYAKFKLFDKQINGGINEVCEVTYNGVPYKDLNNAMKINIGLDVINTISAHYGVVCPLMIDNAESVNEIYHTKAQQIRFYVSLDKALRIEAAE